MKVRIKTIGIDKIGKDTYIVTLLLPDKDTRTIFVDKDNAERIIIDSPELLIDRKSYRRKKDYLKERRKEFAKKGICPRCQKKKIWKGRSICKNCLKQLAKNRAEKQGVPIPRRGY